MTTDSLATLSMAQLNKWRVKLEMAYDNVVDLRKANRTEFTDFVYSNWYIRDGHATVTTAEGQLSASAGQWLLVSPLSRRSQHFTADSHIISIRISITDELEQVVRFDGLPLRCEDTALTHAAEQLIAACGPGVDTLTDWMHTQQHTFHWLQQWYATLRRSGGSLVHSGSGDARVDRVIALLRQHHGLGALPYAAMEQAAGLSRAQLDRIFHDALGLSPRRWQEQRCLHLAQQALSDSDAPLKAIAHSLRFHDAAHFSKWFRSQNGMSPRDWRRLGPAG